MDISALGPGSSVYFVGIKGTGTSALAELMQNAGIKVSGSDTAEVFYTDAVLKELKIPYHESFDPSHIKSDFDLVVYSAAYNETNPELAEAQRLGIPAVKYSDALGQWSAGFDSSGIAGVHGKTTTTAIIGALLKATGIPAQILAASAVADFNGRATLTLGNKYFVAETCEYRRHFLAFRPRRVILTAVECDHQDYYPDYESIRAAFIEYCLLPGEGGELIYCADDPGASDVARAVEKENRGIVLIPYGFSAEGDFRITSSAVKNERTIFTVSGFSSADGERGGKVKVEEFAVQIPGVHQALNGTAALALTSILVKKEGGWNGEKIRAVKEALGNFRGSKRRSEILGEAGGIIFMDDYGHHPTAIKATLAGLRSFYPTRRIVISFMSHTYTRTAALFEDFASSFSDADILFLHKIYASAREVYSGGVTGISLFEKTAERRAGKKESTFYFDEPLEAFEPAKAVLRPGDLFITMGAGNNRALCEKLFEYFKSASKR